MTQAACILSGKGENSQNLITFFEPTCARWAHKHRFPFVCLSGTRPKITRKKFISSKPFVICPSKGITLSCTPHTLKVHCGYTPVKLGIVSEKAGWAHVNIKLHFLSNLI